MRWSSWLKFEAVVPRTNGMNYLLYVRNFEDLSMKILSPGTLLAFILILASPVHGATTILSDTNVWKYNTNGVDLGIGWRANNYNDNGWASGAGVFSVGATLPSGTVVLTPLPLKNTNSINLNTIYFRTHFNFTNDPVCVSITASNLIDDGAVFYINGQELARNNISVGPVTYDATASSVIGNPVWKSFTFLPYLLQQGDNVIAVEVHQVNATSTDMTFGHSLSINSLTPSTSLACR